MIFLKRQLDPISLPGSVLISPTADAVVDGFAMRGILYKVTLARGQRCSRLRPIDEAEISTPVVVNQLAASARRKLYGHSPPAGVDRRALTSTSVVNCQFFELFGACRFPSYKLASPWNCSAAHELLLCYWKILLLEVRNSSPVQTF